MRRFAGKDVSRDDEGAQGALCVDVFFFVDSNA